MVGIDIISVDKIKEKNEDFLRKVFTQNELSYSFNKENPYQTLAGIYALKEATIKAYDLDFSYLYKSKIEVLHKYNRPLILIDKNKVKASVSISHDEGRAIGVCIMGEKEKISIDKNIKSLLKPRDKKSHKGNYGRIAILGGSSGMAGSVYLASKASLRTGAGLVYLICPQSISDILQIKSCEQIINPIDSYNLKYNKLIFKQVLGYLDNKDVLAIGPGMGKGFGLNRLIADVLSVFKGKIIIDADGLNAIAKDKNILHNKNNIILTPHLMEFSRLTGLSLDNINSDRINIAKNFAKTYKVILVLKSESTIVTDGSKLYINKIGNPGMATAGCGDVLTGVIAGLIPRLNQFEAAKLGVYLHSLAADMATFDMGEDSIIASDIIEYLPKAMRLLR